MLEDNALVWPLKDLMLRYGVTRSTIADWALANPEMRELKGQELKNGYYNVLASDLCYIESLKNRIENMGSRAKKIEMETKKLEEQVLLLQIERFEKQKKLMPVELISDDITNMFVMLRQNMQSLPAKLAGQVTEMKDRREVFDYLKEEIDSFLQDLAGKLDSLLENDDPELLTLMESRYGDLWTLFQESDYD